MAEVALKPYPQIPEGMPIYLDANFRALLEKVQELETRLKALGG